MDNYFIILFEKNGSGGIMEKIERVEGVDQLIRRLNFLLKDQKKYKFKVYKSECLMDLSQ